MTKPVGNLANSINAATQKKRDNSGGVGATFAHSDDKPEMKKATYLVPAELHRELQLHAVHSGKKMSELVIRYIREGMNADQQAS